MGDGGNVFFGKLFLSTPSARRATSCFCLLFGQTIISIHALREEGDRGCHDPVLLSRKISIHALREEGDILGGSLTLCIANFYPRPPRGGRRPCLPVSRPA